MTCSSSKEREHDMHYFFFCVSRRFSVSSCSSYNELERGPDLHFFFCAACRFSVSSCSSYKELEPDWRASLSWLHDDYFYRYIAVS